jgi:hypothetical protein
METLVKVYLNGFKIVKRDDGFYAIACDDNGRVPLLANALGPCVSEKQAAFLYIRRYCR